MELVFTLLMLIFLQIVLGFDNLLYISLESKRAPEEQRAYVRKVGLGIAIGLRIVLLFVITGLIAMFQSPWFKIGTVNYTEDGKVDHHHVSPEFMAGEFSLHAIIVLLGGAFIIYTAMKEIIHMMSLEESHHEEKASASTGRVIAMIVLMNLVFSFDSILGAIALTSNFYVMAAAIVVSGVLMIVLADHVSTFLARNRMYEVLGLFILFLVGVMLVTEGAHLAHLSFWGNPIHAMSKATFYFVLVVLVVVDVVQSRYQRKLLALKEARAKHAIQDAAKTEPASA